MLSYRQNAFLYRSQILNRKETGKQVCWYRKFLNSMQVKTIQRLIKLHGCSSYYQPQRNISYMLMNNQIRMFLFIHFSFIPATLVVWMKAHNCSLTRATKAFSSSHNKGCLHICQNVPLSKSEVGFLSVTLVEL